MKIGILTFHAQTNYGGVLQAFALQTYLERQGHSIQIIDRWKELNNASLSHYFLTDKWTLRKRFQYVKSYLKADGFIEKLDRVKTTRSFINKYLKLTPYHFYKWEEIAGTALDFDMIIVGSDQVWNCIYNPVKIYLLNDAPVHCKKIAYAASFGMTEIPNEMKSVYQNGFQKFSAISCREKAGCELVQGFGYKAEHVVDPVLLLSQEEWKKQLELDYSPNRKSMFCYFMEPDYLSSISELAAFAKQKNLDINVYFNEFIFSVSVKNYLSHLLKRFKLKKAHIRLHLANGPDKFLKDLVGSDYVLTDSFHAFMFSLIFDKNVRVLSPNNQFRRMMFSRIEEFNQFLTSGTFISRNLAVALQSFKNEGHPVFAKDELAKWSKSSANFLQQELK